MRGAQDVSSYRRTGAPVFLPGEGFNPLGKSGGRSAIRLDVQGLRAIAVLLVFAGHIFGNPPGGFIGVDVFFVISGFLITGLLLRERRRTGRISMREFYARRARRILPAAVLVLVATNLLARSIFGATRAHQTFVDSIASFFFFANVRFSSLGTSYFDALRPKSAVQQYWSLAVEEQFYLVWPCALIGGFLLFRRIGIKGPHTVAGVLAVAMTGLSFAYCLQYTASNPTASYFSTATRAWELGLGALTAVAAAPLLRIPVSVRAAASWVAVATIVVSAFAITETTPFPGFATLFPVVATAVVLASGDVRGGVGAVWALGSRPFQYVGSVSYSLYLWHWPALIFVDAYFGDGLLPHLFAAAVAFGLAVATFALVEEPARHSSWLSRKPPGYVRQRSRVGDWVADNERVLLPVVAGIVLFVGALTWQAAEPDPPSAVDVAAVYSARQARTTVAETDNDDPGASVLAPLIKASLEVPAWGRLEPSIDNISKAAPKEWTRDDCLEGMRNGAACTYGSSSAPRLAVLLGDSVSLSYLPGIREALDPLVWRVRTFTLLLCPMVDIPTRRQISAKTADDRCIQHRQAAIAEVQRLQPDLVIISSSASSINKVIRPAGTSFGGVYAMWQEGTTRMIRSLGAPDRRVVVITGAPGAGNLQECVTVRSSPRDCTKALPPYWGPMLAAENAAARGLSAVHVDPTGWFCYSGSCPAVIGSTPVYWDGGHLTEAYSRSLGPLLTPLLRTP